MNELDEITRALADKFSKPEPPIIDEISEQKFAQDNINLGQNQAAKNSEISSSKNTQISSEIEFLTSLKERVLVLFEGLNSFEVDDMGARVALNVKFLEFLLATIDERLEHLE